MFVHMHDSKAWTEIYAKMYQLECLLSLYKQCVQFIGLTDAFCTIFCYNAGLNDEKFSINGNLFNELDILKMISKFICFL
jgi:hypothetical protein